MMECIKCHNRIIVIDFECGIVQEGLICRECNHG